VKLAQLPTSTRFVYSSFSLCVSIFFYSCSLGF